MGVLASLGRKLILSEACCVRSDEDDSNQRKLRQRSVPEQARSGSRRPGNRRSRGKQVRVGLLTGTALTGEVIATSRYNLVLKLKDGEQVLLYKHALAYLRRLADDDTKRQAPS